MRHAKTTPHQKIHRVAAEFKTTSARKSLKPRKKPYWLQIEKGLCVGYLRRADPKPGLWYGRREIGRTESGAPDYDCWRLEGVADDCTTANAETVLTYADAVTQVNQQANDRGSGRTTHGRYAVRQAIMDYLQFRQGKKGDRSRRDAESKFEKHVLSHDMATIDVNKLTLHDLHSWQAGLVRHEEHDADIERRSKDTANRVLRDLKAALNHAFDNRKQTGVLSKEEWGRKLKPLTYGNASPTKPREFHFDIPTILRVIDAAEPAFADVLRAAIYTGGRPGDLMKLRVHDFHPTHRELIIPKGKTKERTTTLTTEATAFFRGLAKDRTPNAFLLTKADGTPWQRGDQRYPMRKALIAAGVATKQELRTMPRRERPVLYSLRHTYISRSIENNVPLLLIANNVGTSIGQIEKHYGKILERMRRNLIEQGAPSLKAAARA